MNKNVNKKRSMNEHHNEYINEESLILDSLYFKPDEISKQISDNKLHEIKSFLLKCNYINEQRLIMFNKEKSLKDKKLNIKELFTTKKHILKKMKTVEKHYTFKFILDEAKYYLVFKNLIGEKKISIEINDKLIYTSMLNSKFFFYKHSINNHSLFFTKDIKENFNLKIDGIDFHELVIDENNSQFNLIIEPEISENTTKSINDEKIGENNNYIKTESKDIISPTVFKDLKIQSKIMEKYASNIHDKSLDDFSNSVFINDNLLEKPPSLNKITTSNNLHYISINDMNEFNNLYFNKKEAGVDSKSDNAIINTHFMSESDKCKSLIKFFKDEEILLTNIINNPIKLKKQGSKLDYDCLKNCSFTSKKEDRTYKSITNEYNKKNPSNQFTTDYIRKTMTSKLLFNYENTIHKDKSLFSKDYSKFIITFLYRLLKDIKENRKIFFYDEYGINSCRKSNKILIHKSESKDMLKHKTFDKLNILLICDLEKIIYYEVHKDKTNTERVINFFKNFRKSKYNNNVKGETIVIDNAGYHNLEDVHKKIFSKNVRLLFIPSHTPQCNMVEFIIGNIKDEIDEYKYDYR